MALTTSMMHPASLRGTDSAVWEVHNFFKKVCAANNVLSAATLVEVLPKVDELNDDAWLDLKNIIVGLYSLNVDNIFWLGYIDKVLWDIVQRW